jgi:hypothetical protein
MFQMFYSILMFGIIAINELSNLVFGSFWICCILFKKSLAVKIYITRIFLITRDFAW